MMATISEYGNIPINYSTVCENIGEYKSPKDKVVQLVNSGTFIRLKKGLYVVSPKVSNQTLSVELISNHLYGPSYISFETALSMYGLIPERAYTIKSATAKRGKKYTNSIGDFKYISVPDKYFAIGIVQKIVNNTYAYIIASPEKALCDLITTTAGLRIQSKKAMREYLIENLRLDIDGDIHWNPDIVEECAKYGYKKNELSLLAAILKEYVQ